MTPEEIERLSLDDLKRTMTDPQTVVPEELRTRLRDIACAARLDAGGMASLDGHRHRGESARRRYLWLRGLVPATALAALAAVLLLPRRSPQPKDTFTDPKLAYAELTQALALFGEALQTGSADAATAFSELGQSLAEIQENL